LFDINDAVRYLHGVKNGAAPAGERVIKRYGNRKLYDAVDRHYVTLEDLAAMIGRGEELHVVDQKTGEDLTTTVLAQVILEGLKARTASIPRQVLTRLIRLGAAPAAAWAEWNPQHAATRARDEAERIASGLMAKGRLTLEEAFTLRQDIAQSVQRLAGEAQRSVEGHVHKLLDKTEREGAIGASLQGLRERLMAFETYLAPSATPARRKAAGRKRRRG
jgi:polyhydroxyalkanoate synthesis repressor PhaR